METSSRAWEDEGLSSPDSSASSEPAKPSASSKLSAPWKKTQTGNVCYSGRKNTVNLMTFANTHTQFYVFILVKLIVQDLNSRTEVDCVIGVVVIIVSNPFSKFSRQSLLPFLGQLRWKDTYIISVILLYIFCYSSLIFLWCSGRHRPVSKF